MTNILNTFYISNIRPKICFFFPISDLETCAINLPASSDPHFLPAHKKQESTYGSKLIPLTQIKNSTVHDLTRNKVSRLTRNKSFSSSGPSCTPESRSKTGPLQSRGMNGNKEADGEANNESSTGTTAGNDASLHNDTYGCTHTPSPPAHLKMSSQTEGVNPTEDTNTNVLEHGPNNITSGNGSRSPTGDKCDSIEVLRDEDEGVDLHRDSDPVLAPPTTRSVSDIKIVPETEPTKNDHVADTVKHERGDFNDDSSREANGSRSVVSQGGSDSSESVKYGNPSPSLSEIQHSAEYSSSEDQQDSTDTSSEDINALSESTDSREDDESVDFGGFESTSTSSTSASTSTSLSAESWSEVSPPAQIA